MEETALQIACAPSGITDNLAEIDAEVERRIAPFLNAEIDPFDEGQVKDARKAMAWLNGMKKPIEDERKAAKRAWEAPFKALEARVKATTDKIDECRANLKRQVDEADALFRDARSALLEAEYEGVAGPMADVIPFSALLDEKWLNRSVPESKALKSVQDAAEEALKGWEAIASANLAHPDECRKVYADTLDLAKALAHDAELTENERRMAEWKAAQEAMAAAKAQTAPEPAPAPSPAPRFRWGLKMEFEGDRAFAERVAMALKGLGVTGAAIECLGVCDGQ